MVPSTSAVTRLLSSSRVAPDDVASEALCANDDEVSATAGLAGGGGLGGLPGGGGCGARTMTTCRIGVLTAAIDTSMPDSVNEVDTDCLNTGACTALSMEATVMGVSEVLLLLLPLSPVTRTTTPKLVSVSKVTATSSTLTPSAPAMALEKNCRSATVTTSRRRQRLLIRLRRRPPIDIVNATASTVDEPGASGGGAEGGGGEGEGGAGG